MNSYECNLCHSPNHIKLGNFHGRILLSCGSCGLRSYFPTPSSAELKELYSNDHYVSANYFAVEDTSTTNHIKQLRRIASIFGSRIACGGKVLEVGPGKGRFIDFCKEQGLKIDALELSQPMAQQIRQRTGCTVLETTLEFSGFPQDSYSAIAAFDLLEHVQDPKGWLLEAWRVLVPGGILAFSTVNYKTVLDVVGRLMHALGVQQPFKKLHPPYHLYYFTPTIVSAYIKSACFNLESIIHENYDIKKASSNALEQVALCGIYLAHNMFGFKTNMYVVCTKN
jgi:2-polyprenyl-3-methyl-5-hydroxy-6-metoxy-1,4-benzoquinol methylase